MRPAIFTRLERTARAAILARGPVPLLVLAATIGSASGLVSSAFWNAIAAFSAALSFYVVAPLDRAAGFLPAPSSWRVLAPAAGGLIVGLLARWVFRTPERLGVPAVMLDARQAWGRIPLRYVPATFVNSVLTIGSGGSAGREAPVVAMGGALGAWAARRLGMPRSRRRLLVGCGAAAAIAAAFNAPLAGVFFALELILGDWRTGTLAPVMVASVAGTVVCRATEGSAEAIHFRLPAYAIGVWWEVFAYAALGAAAGVFGHLFIRTYHALERGFARISGWWRPALGGMAVGVMGLWLPQVLGNGYPQILAACHGQFSLTLLLVLALAKILATALTLGSGGWGGDFAPTLFVGAMVGGAVGSLFDAVLPAGTGDVGAYAMVGMGAMLAAVVRCPATAVLLMFEMTSSYQVILPIMVAVAVATVVARRFDRRGLYHQRLEELGGPSGEALSESALATVRVGDLMHTSFETIAERTPYPEVVAHVSGAEQVVFPVVRDDGTVLGVIRLVDLRRHLSHLGERFPVVAADLALEEIPEVTPKTPAEEAAALLTAAEWDEVPVLAGPNDRRAVGLLSRHDILRATVRMG
ncbi:MAG: chloride channel protein [Acidobacteriota bacterium]